MASLNLPALVSLTRIINACSSRICHPSVIRFRNFSTEGANPKPVDPAADPNLSESEKKLKDEIDGLSKDLDMYKDKTREFEDKYKRSLADGENLRRRMTKQIEDAKTFSIQSFCKDLLEVADTLSKATDSVPKDQVSEANPHLKSLFDGLIMTEAQLKQVFRRHNLEAVNPIKEKFDPNLHEALFAQEVEGAEPGTVVVVSKIGYKLRERCVRPALVGVAK